MRTYNDEYDTEEAERIKAQPWQIDLLKLNPEYVSWGPGEDYMTTGDKGWATSQRYSAWKKFGPWGLDDLNECVNFYFQVDRDSKKCPSCNGNGYHSDSQEVVNSFYGHMNNKGEEWCHNITQDEVEALVHEGRLRDFVKSSSDPIPLASEVNQWARTGMGHDAINRGILIKTRLARFGLPLYCDECQGHGHVFTSPEAHVSVVLWILHPRKGASKGLEVRIEREDLPEVFAWLKDAAARNAGRFNKVLEAKP